jgi:tetratricopeptide (TPR) repeat protein
VNWLRLLLGAAVLASAVGANVRTIRGEEQVQRFVEALHSAAYPELAAAYLERFLARPDLPAPQRSWALRELGRSFMEAAALEGDPHRQGVLLNRGEKTLRRVLAEFPQSLEAADAQLDLARLRLERAKLLLNQAKEALQPEEAERWRAQARAVLEEARTAFREAVQRFEQRMKALPLRPDPKQRLELDGHSLSAREAQLLRQHTEQNWIVAQFQLALVAYYEAGTFPPDSDARRQALKEAIKQLEEVYYRYRSYLAGLHARMWMAKCFEELGEYKKALGLYEELLRHNPAEQTSPQSREALRHLQRQVRYFWILAQNRVGAHRQALEAAQQWLRAHSSHRWTPLGFGVLMEQGEAARELAIQLPESSPERRRLLGLAVESWQTVARQPSEYQLAAQRELRRWGPLVGRAPGAEPRTLAEALALGQAAAEQGSWKEAARLFGRAVQLASPREDVALLNDARLRYALALLKLGHWEEAAVLAEHLVRCYPSSPQARQGAQLALASYWAAYRAWSTQSRLPAVSASLLSKATELAHWLVSRWPASSEADQARLVLASRAWAEKRWREAATQYEQVSPSSEAYVRSRLLAAEAYWMAYASSPLASEREDWLRKVEQLALAAQRSEGAEATNSSQATPESQIQADILLSRVHLARGNPVQAQRLLERYLVAVLQRQDLAALRSPFLVTLLQAYLASGDLEGAERTFFLLDEPSGEAELALLNALAEQLGAELRRLEAEGRKHEAQQRRETLEALCTRIADHAPMQHVGQLEGLALVLMEVGAVQAARRVLTRALELLGDQQGADVTRRRRALQLALARAARLEGDWKTAASILRGADGQGGLLREQPHAVDAVMEYGRLLSWKAAAENQKHAWDEALQYWASISRWLAGARQRPREYAEAWAHLCLCRLVSSKFEPKDRRRKQLDRVLAEATYFLKTCPQPLLQSKPVGSAWEDFYLWAKQAGVEFARQDTVEGLFRELMRRAAEQNDTKTGQLPVLRSHSTGG